MDESSKIKTKTQDLKKQENSIEQNAIEENRNVVINQDTPEMLTNNIYTPAFLRENIGKLMRTEFLIATNNLVDRIGILVDVGASYILLRSLESDTITYCDIYSIKFITISNNRIYPINYNQNGGYEYTSNYNSQMSNQMLNSLSNSNSNMYRYY